MATELKKLIEHQRTAQEALANIEAQIEQARHEQRTGIRDRHAAEYAELGLTPEEVWADLIPKQKKRGRPAKAAAKPAGRKLVPKYVNPENREQVYSKGKYPAWLPRKRDGSLDTKKLEDKSYQLTAAERKRYEV